MRTLTRVLLAGAVAGTALIAPSAHASQEVYCVTERCYQCFMYPCGPGDWVEFIGNRVRNLCVDAAGTCS